MKSSMISVRLNTNFLKELKKCSEEDHYQDVSEAVRSIIRNKWIKERDPITYQLDKLRKEFDSKATERNETIVKELQTIKEQMLRSSRGDKQ